MNRIMMNSEEPKKDIITQKDIITISELAHEFDVSTRSIRFYEEKGMISPGRTNGNQRFYTKRDRARLRLILRGKRFGYTLEEIAEIIGMTDVDYNEAEQLRKALKFGDRRLAEIRERISELQHLEHDLMALHEHMDSRLKELEVKKDKRAVEEYFEE
ncbi:MerR family transcriptional regulator [Desulforegula conservatrix]|uniref:MerR family transcriptional regulator n=1 Tax=Desulforegula conservatrix TaxID=153026 RepID=UPI001E414944|nr:MerR family DNA-binding transcriptional regulator [Desulforegula conservatrix]